MADEQPDRDNQSLGNKLAHLAAVGLVEPTYVQVPLDPDLAEAFGNAIDATTPLSKTDVLLLQIMRMLKGMANAGSGSSEQPAAGQPAPGQPGDAGA